MGPTQFRTFLVPGASYLGVKQPEREADHSPHLVRSLGVGGSIPLSRHMPLWLFLPLPVVAE
jgi:hypothetical protein